MVLEQTRQIIDEAELVLVGLGEELESGFSVLQASTIYHQFCTKLKEENLDEESYAWIYPYLLKQAEMESEEAKTLNAFYGTLRKLLENKNYFIITMNMDSMPEENGFPPERIVKPFGNYDLLQCAEACTEELWDAGKERERVVQAVTDSGQKLSALKRSVCPRCQAEAVFNNVNAAHYIEEGYLPQWKAYTKWVEGTMNRKVCILELGVMLNYPSMIRWPFEKMGYLNQKASFVRVNSQIPQLTSELGAKGISVRENPAEFFLDR